MSDNETLGVFLTKSGYHVVSSEVFFIGTVINILILSTALAIFGCITNIINMVVFSKLGFKDSINISLFGLSAADFGSSITLIGMAIAYNPLFLKANLSFSPFEIMYLAAGYPHFIFTKITTAITAFIAFERCLCVAMPLKVKTIISPRIVRIFVCFSFIILMASSIPGYYYNRVTWKFNPLLNRSILGIVYTPDKNQIAAILWPIHNVVFSIFPFILISICTGILVINLKKKSAWRQTAVATTKSEDASTKEMRVVKTMVLISTLFIVCAFPTFIFVLISAFTPSFNITSSNLFTFIGTFLTILESINSSMNLFIYHRTSSKYNAMFKQIFCFEKTKS